MTFKKIIPHINAENERNESVIKRAIAYERSGADELFIYNYTILEAEREEFIQTMKTLVKTVDIPVLIGCFVNRFEDIKKAFYTGATKVVVPYAKIKDETVIKEAVDRFGTDNIVVEFDVSPEKNDGILSSDSLMDKMLSYGVTKILLKHVNLTKSNMDKIDNMGFDVFIRDSLLRNDMATLLSMNHVVGVSTDLYEAKNIMKIKHVLKASGISTDTFESSIPFSEFKKDANGLVPVIVQDYKTNEVLMLAYMDELAYNTTIETGKMTYHSRSRNELWIKGETSGHHQYVRSLQLDCDKDTILAKVLQVGAACHTGNKTCFYRDLVRKEYDETNPLTVFEDVYKTIADRFTNPKEGSYTNYLFDKGIDKILKKCGEESTEIIIAAKNPNAEELKYEIADYLYHLMVLMVNCNVDWDDITTELSHRR